MIRQHLIHWYTVSSMSWPSSPCFLWMHPPSVPSFASLLSWIPNFPISDRLNLSLTNAFKCHKRLFCKSTVLPSQLCIPIKHHIHNALTLWLMSHNTCFKSVFWGICFSHSHFMWISWGFYTHTRRHVRTLTVHPALCIKKARIIQDYGQRGLSHFPSAECGAPCFLFARQSVPAIYRMGAQPKSS